MSLIFKRNVYSEWCNMKSYLLRLFIMVLSFSALIQAVVYAAKPTDKKESNLTLSGTEIDLLVGTPEGIAEPLDSRRNVISKDNQVDYSGFLDENALSDEMVASMSWEDAEDSEIDESKVENQLMDLLAETEELEKTDEIYYGDESEEEQNN